MLFGESAWAGLIVGGDPRGVQDQAGVPGDDVRVGQPGARPGLLNMSSQGQQAVADLRCPAPAVDSGGDETGLVGIDDGLEVPKDMRATQHVRAVGVDVIGRPHASWTASR